MKVVFVTKQLFEQVAINKIEEAGIAMHQHRQKVKGGGTPPPHIFKYRLSNNYNLP